MQGFRTVCVSQPAGDRGIILRGELVDVYPGACPVRRDRQCHGVARATAPRALDMQTKPPGGLGVEPGRDSARREILALEVKSFVGRGSTSPNAVNNRSRS